MLFCRVVREESTVMRIAGHGTKDHPQVAGATRASSHQIEGLSKVDNQIVDLP
jgi:hypothetical protein